MVCYHQAFTWTNVDPLSAKSCHIQTLIYIYQQKGKPTQLYKTIIKRGLKAHNCRMRVDCLIGNKSLPESMMIICQLDSQAQTSLYFRLNHRGIVTPHCVIKLGQRWFSYCRVAGETKPLPELKITNHQWGLLVFTCGKFHEKMSKKHYDDVKMDMIGSQITSLTIVYSTVYSGADQRKHQSSASLAFVLGIHRWPVISRTNGQ